MADQDLRIGANIARWRGEESQQTIADAMRTKGWKWTQATMWALEKGDRSLKLAEAGDLAEILGVEVAQLLSPLGASALWEKLEKAVKAVNSSATGVSLETSDMLIYQDELKSVLPDFESDEFRQSIRGTEARAVQMLDELLQAAHLALQRSPEDEVRKVRGLREQRKKATSGKHPETS